MQQERKFDSNSLIGFILIGFILIGFTFYNQYTKKEESSKNILNKTMIINNDNDVIKTSDSLISNLNLSSPRHDIFSFENDKINLKIKSQGGQIYQVKLKKYFAYDKTSNDHQKPLYLINNNTKFGFTFKLKNGRLVDTRTLFFQKIKHKDSSLVLRSQISNAWIEFYYEFKKDYSIGFQIKTKNLYQITSEKNVNLNFSHKLFLLEKGHYQENSYTEINYSYDNFSKDDYWASRSFEESEKVDWIAFKQQFFSTILESQNKFTKLQGTPKNFGENSGFLKEFNVSSQISFSNDLNEKFIWYFCPLDLDYLKTVGKQFHRLIPFGWGIFNWLNVFFLSIYKLLEGLGIASGWIIFLMTIIIKLITSPIMYKQFKQSAMMRVLRPELEELNEKHKDSDTFKKQQAIMDLYRKAGVNPMAGCLPALLQMPLFIALYRFFPNVIDLRGKDFLWADDLTAYDSICSLTFSIPFYGDHISLFTILYCIILLIYTRMTSGNIQQHKQKGIPDMKLLMYIMPLMFIFILNSLASGLSWYYFISNVLNVMIILFINKFLIDENKIHSKIQENKSNPKRKAKWQQKMQEIIEKMQEQQKNNHRKK